MKLSSYNIKCLVIYILYCLFFFFIGEGTFFDDDVKNYVFQYIAIPLIVYLLLPFVLKIIGHWRMVKWIDGVIDYLYRSIKEPGIQQLFHIEKADATKGRWNTEEIIPKVETHVYYNVTGSTAGDIVFLVNFAKDSGRSFLKTKHQCIKFALCIVSEYAMHDGVMFNKWIGDSKDFDLTPYI